jgi:hypothetical protein
MDGTTTRPGTGADAAASWLASLTSAVAAKNAGLVGLPYGDTDLVALSRDGLEKEIAIARSTGQSLLTAELRPPTMPNTVWPVAGLLDETTLDDVASDLVDTVVLTDQALPPRDANAVTGARADLQTASGTVHAVLTDSTLAAIVADGGRSADGGTRAAEQRFLAETMLVTEQRPGVGSSLVIAPPRTLDPANGFAATLLADTGTMPWLQPVNLAKVAASASDGVPRTPLAYPDSARRVELPPSALTPISGLRGDLAAFNALVGSSSTETFINTASVAMLRAESSSLRGNLARAADIRAAVQGELALKTAKVYISNPRLITLTSRKQKIPITVVNTLPEPVTVQIQLSAVNAARLKVTALGPFTVDGNGSRHEVLVEVEATTGGRFQVYAQLLTPEATPHTYGAPVSFELNSTAYGAVALSIAAAAAGLLFLLSAIRLTRRVARARRQHRAGHVDPDPPDGTPGDANGTSGTNPTNSTSKTNNTSLDDDSSAVTP